ncbi:cytochrome b562 [Porticoccaceae bacterium LTM1]|nr:cytochrome b562 [Porticoccaceae bacterium LTM1]
MRNVIKLLSAAALLGTFAIAPTTYAAKPAEDSVVSKNFKQVGRTLRGLRSAETADDVAKILTKVKKFSEKNRDEIPTVLGANSPKLADYTKGMDNFIAKVDEALKLAEAGDKDGAMKIVSTFRETKQKAHKHFEVD